MAPAKVFDNLYLLGMKTATAWALTTSEGIILFDAMFHYNVEETVVGSMRQLGLDPADIKYVIITHAHADHFGGAALSARHVRRTHRHGCPRLGAHALMAATRRARAVSARRHRRTRRLHDHARRHDGADRSDARAYAGHDLADLPRSRRRRRALRRLLGRLGRQLLAPEGIVEYMGSVDRFARIDPRIDVPLTNHPFIDATLSKIQALAARRRGEPHPFVEGNSGFRAWLTTIHDCAGEVLESKLATR